MAIVIEDYQTEILDHPSTVSSTDEGEVAQETKPLSLGQVVAGNVEVLQVKLGIRDVDLANRTGLSGSYFTRMRQGRVSEPGHTSLKRIAAALGVTIEALTEGVDSKVSLPVPASYYAAEYGLQNELAISLLSKLAEVFAYEDAKKREANSQGVNSNEGQVIEGLSPRDIYRLLLNTINDVLFEYVREHWDELSKSESTIGLAEMVIVWQRLNNEQRQRIIIHADNLVKSNNDKEKDVAR